MADVAQTSSKDGVRKSTICSTAICSSAVSNDTGSSGIFRSYCTFSRGNSVSREMSLGVASDPMEASSCAFRTMRRLSVTWTGTRMVRPVSGQLRLPLGRKL
jgi:hypothetical protein